MGSELSDFSSIARDLVLRNRARIFPNIRGSIEVIDVELGRRKFIQDDRYHCRLTVHYRADGSTKSLQMWLKFRPQLHTLLPILDARHERLNGQVFPRAYSAWCAQDGSSAVRATAYVRGITLRNRLLMLAAFRQTSRLLPIFRLSGTKMRRLWLEVPRSPAMGYMLTRPLIEFLRVAQGRVTRSALAALLRRINT